MSEPKKLRVLVDTNVFVSYLIARTAPSSAAGALLEAASAGGYQLLIADAIVSEIYRTVRGRKDLASKIDERSLGTLINGLRALAEPIPPVTEGIPTITRDPKDDYLIAHAVVGAADVLVSWDRDLLDLGEIAGVRLVSPPQLLEELRARDETRGPTSERR